MQYYPQYEPWLQLLKYSLTVVTQLFVCVRSTTLCHVTWLDFPQELDVDDTTIVHYSTVVWLYGIVLGCNCSMSKGCMNSVSVIRHVVIWYDIFVSFLFLAIKT